MYTYKKFNENIQIKKDLTLYKLGRNSSTLPLVTRTLELPLIRKKDRHKRSVPLSLFLHKLALV